MEIRVNKTEEVIKSFINRVNSIRIIAKNKSNEDVIYSPIDLQYVLDRLSIMGYTPTDIIKGVFYPKDKYLLLSSDEEPLLKNINFEAMQKDFSLKGILLIYEDEQNYGIYKKTKDNKFMCIFYKNNEGNITWKVEVMEKLTETEFYRLWYRWKESIL